MKSKAITGIMLTVFLIGMLALTFNINGGYVLADDTYWRIERVDSSGDAGFDTSITLDSNDYPHIMHALRLGWGKTRSEKM